MANVYFKIMNKKLAQDYSDRIINSIQSEILTSAGIVNNNLFDELNAGRNPLRRNCGLNINEILKYYIINQVFSQPNELNLRKTRYEKTPNKNYVKDPIKNVYYKVTDDGIKPVENMCSINPNGSYVINEKRCNSSFLIKKLYDVSDELISIQLVNQNGTVIGSKVQAAEIMGMRKEFAYRYKYSGYSGNSNDIVATILNHINTPIETGYYMDTHYNLYSWSESEKCFYRKLNDNTSSPLLIDYEFESYQKVIRKEYTGT